MELNGKRNCDDEARGSEVQNRSPDGRKHLGPPRSPYNKREYGPGQHGQRRKGKATDFGTQLKAKQKVKGYYGNISERQFHKYYVEARRLRGTRAPTSSVSSSEGSTR